MQERALGREGPGAHAKAYRTSSAPVHTTTLATAIAMMGTSAHLSHVGYWTRASSRPGRNTAVGLNRLARPFAAQKIVMTTSGAKPRFAASGPRMGIEMVASAEVEVMTTDRPRYTR